MAREWAAGDLAETFVLPSGLTFVARFPGVNDQESVNAWEIKSDNGFREDKKKRLNCPECHHEPISRVYVGKDDDGVVRRWQFTPARSIKGRKIPATAIQFPTKDDPRQFATIPECRRCRRAYLVYSGSGRATELGRPTLSTLS